MTQQATALPKGYRGDMANGFKDGSLDMIVDGPWAAGGYAADVANLGVAPMPAGPAGPALPLVGVDGWNPQDVGTAGLPNEPTAVAAAPGRLPLVSAAGSIWEFSAGTWVTLIAGQEPLPGTEPFFPM